MGRLKKPPRGTGKDLTQGIKHPFSTPDTTKTPKRKDGVPDDEIPDISQLATQAAPAIRMKNGALKPGSVAAILDSQWDKCLKAANNGYEFQTIAKTLGISHRAFLYWLKKHPKRKQQLIEAKLAPRDLCVQVILNAAKAGQWLPAAWWLERTCWQEFARPEVKLQMLDRVMNQNEVVQTFNGRSLQQINQELRQQHAENPNFQRAVGRNQPQVDAVRSELDTGGTADSDSEGGSN